MLENFDTPQHSAAYVQQSIHRRPTFTCGLIFLLWKSCRSRRLDIIRIAMHWISGQLSGDEIFKQTKTKKEEDQEHPYKQYHTVMYNIRQTDTASQQ